MAISRSSRGEKLVWPPSVPSATQPSPAGMRPLTPSPVPAPSTPTTLRSRASPPPTCRRCCGASRGSDMASAVKSFTTTSVCSPSRCRICSMEKRQW